LVTRRALTHHLNGAGACHARTHNIFLKYLITENYQTFPNQIGKKIKSKMTKTSLKLTFFFFQISMVILTSHGFNKWKRQKKPSVHVHFSLQKE
jgi:hypothetical protein